MFGTGSPSSEDMTLSTARHGYPPDMQEKATQTVLEQAEVLSEMRVVA